MNILTSFLEFAHHPSSKTPQFSMTESQMPLNCIPSSTVVNEIQTLPTNFAQQILQLQISLQQSNCDINMIQRLNELYMIGLQFHGKNLKSQTRKREHFVKKIQSLYRNKYVLRIIQKQNNYSTSICCDCNKDIETAKNNTYNLKQNKQKDNEQKILVKRKEVQPALYEAKLKQQISKFSSQSKDVVKNILEQNLKKEIKKQQKIDKMLKHQDENLKNRLEKRTQKILNGKLKQSMGIFNNQN